MLRNTEAYYDAFYSYKDYAKEARAVRAIIERHTRSGGNALLDVACGTGSHLLHLRRHYRVEGVDLDAGMLKVARKRLKGVPLHRGDMRAFDLRKQFDAVVCLFSAIGYAKDRAGLKRALATFARHTKPGGDVVVEPWILLENFESGRAGIQTSKSRGVTLARAFRTRRRGRVSFLEFEYLIAKGGRVEHAVETHELGLFTLGEYIRAFEKAGLEVRFLKRGLTGRGLLVGSKTTR